MLDKDKSGGYWSAAQLDEENDKVIPLMLNVKNKAVGNWYAIMGALGNATSGTQGTINLNTSTPISPTPLYWENDSVKQGYIFANWAATASNGAIWFRAGTDTTTATTATMADIVSPTANSPYSSSVLYPTVSASLLSVQWSGVWNSNAFSLGGSPATIVLGEFGLTGGGVSGGGVTLLRRVCVADGNFSPLTVTTSLPLTVTVNVTNQ